METAKRSILPQTHCRAQQHIPRAPRRGHRWTRIGSALAVLAGLVGFTLPAAPAQAAAPTIVSLTFDDGNDNQFAAAETLKGAGLRGTFFVASGYLDTPTFMSTSQVQALQADGHEIGGHTLTHTDLVGLGTDEALRQVCDDRVSLTNRGLDITSFAYPFASSSPEAQSVVQDCGYNSARGLGDVRSKAPESESWPVAEMLPPPNPYLTGAPAQVESTWTLEDLQNLVNQAVTGGGGWVQVTFHNIGRADNPLSISDELYAEYVNWLSSQQAAGIIEVKPVRDVIGGVTQPLVSGPAASGPPVSGSVASESIPPESDAAGNVLPYPGLETAGQPAGLPHWNKSTAPARFGAYYRTALGTWQYRTSSPATDASADWTQGTWTPGTFTPGTSTSPAVPAVTSQTAEPAAAA